MGSGGHLEVVFGAPKTDSMRKCALGVAKTPGNHSQSIRNKILERSYAAFFFWHHFISENHRFQDFWLRIPFWAPFHAFGLYKDSNRNNRKPIVKSENRSILRCQNSPERFFRGKGHSRHPNIHLEGLENRYNKFRKKRLGRNFFYWRLRDFPNPHPTILAPSGGSWSGKPMRSFVRWIQKVRKNRIDTKDRLRRLRIS